MKTLAQHTENNELDRRTNKLLLTASMIACVTAGWFLGNLKTNEHSQPYKENFNYPERSIILPSIPVNGESLPTIILSEFPVVSSSK